MNPPIQHPGVLLLFLLISFIFQNANAQEIVYFNVQGSVTQDEEKAVIQVKSEYTKDSILILKRAYKTNNSWGSFKFDSRVEKISEKEYLFFLSKKGRNDFTKREIIAKEKYGYRIKEISPEGKVLFEASALQLFPLVLHGEYLEFDKDGLPMLKAGYGNGRKYGEELICRAVNAEDIITEKPQFPGGVKSLHKEIARRLKLTPAYIQSKIQETVYVKFCVNENGTVEQVQLANEVSNYMQKEAIRIINSIDKTWIPAKAGEKVVSCWKYVKISTTNLGVINSAAGTIRRKGYMKM